MTLLNLAPANYNYNSSLFSSNVGKVDNIGDNGTVCNTIAAEGKYVNSPGRFEKMMGGDGYGFTDKFPGKIIGPDAGYLGLDKYSAGANAFARAGNVTAHWKNLTGGKRRRYRQVGCKKRGGRTHRHKRTHRRKHTKRTHKRSTRTRRKYRGGNGQPYSNIPQSFGQSFDSKLSPYDSALASPVPMTPYNRCESVSR